MTLLGLKPIPPLSEAELRELHAPLRKPPERTSSLLAVPLLPTPQHPEEE